MRKQEQKVTSQGKVPDHLECEFKSSVEYWPDLQSQEFYFQMLLSLPKPQSLYWSMDQYDEAEWSKCCKRNADVALTTQWRKPLKASPLRNMTSVVECCTMPWGVAGTSSKRWQHALEHRGKKRIVSSLVMLERQIWSSVRRNKAGKT